MAKQTPASISPSGINLQTIAIWHDPSNPSAEIRWGQLGTVVSDLPELYRVSRERLLDLVIVASPQQELTAQMATRIRRSNGLTEIWKVTDDPRLADDDLIYDGFFPPHADHDQVAGRIKLIVQEKRLLARYQMVSRHSSMKGVARTIDRIAPTDISVLVVGPSGAGKELVAKALHADSPRSDRPFVAINCGALAEGVLESELFGHEKGAFTGSIARREGLFHKADGGTIFLDEIGELKADMQVKLLRVLEDGAYYPVGSSTPQRVNVRVVAATNRDLTEAIAEREFREDLYYRIGVVKIVLPSLLTRRGDIGPLIQFFWGEQSKLEISDRALERLMRYDWPGNIRQLRNFASRMTALKPSGLVDLEDIDRFLAEQHSSATHLPVATGKSSEEVGQELIYRAILSMGNEIRMLRDLISSHLPREGSPARATEEARVESVATMEEMEKAMIERVLAATGGNRKETARRLGIGERTLYRKLNRFGLS